MASVILAIAFATAAGIKHQKARAEKKRLERGTITYYPDSDNESQITHIEKPKRESLREKASRKLHRGKSENVTPDGAARRNSEDTLVSEGDTEDALRRGEIRM
jgi:hypothetical protein